MSVVVTEGAFHRRVLDLLLADLADGYDLRVSAASTADAARPLAKRESVVDRQPVVLAVDAGGVDPDRVAAQQADLEFYFSLHSNGLPVSVVQFVPAIEAIFFERPQVLERLLGRKLDEALMIAGEIAPRAVLERLGYHGTLEDRLDALTYGDLCQLRGHPSIAAIREFVVANAEPTLARRYA
jgi:hypothetical protein